MIQSLCAGGAWLFLGMLRHLPVWRLPHSFYARRRAPSPRFRLSANPRRAEKGGIGEDGYGLRPSEHVMSGFDEQEAVGRFIGKGLAGFLQKPFTAEGLRSNVRKILPDRGTSQEAFCPARISSPDSVRASARLLRPSSLCAARNPRPDRGRSCRGRSSAIADAQSRAR